MSILSPCEKIRHNNPIFHKDTIKSKPNSLNTQHKLKHKNSINSHNFPHTTQTVKVIIKHESQKQREKVCSLIYLNTTTKYLHLESQVSLHYRRKFEWKLIINNIREREQQLVNKSDCYWMKVNGFLYVCTC